jgi:hypothetical protein
MAEKTRTTTLQTRFGFSDEELKTPAHDAIMVWLDINMMKIAQGCLETKYKGIATCKCLWAEREADKSIQRFPNLGDKWIKPDYENFPAAKIVSVKKYWESPVMSKQYMIGFLDMRVIAEFTGVDYWQKTEYTLPELFEGKDTVEFVFEVKPKIPSCGELIRQINMYKEYTPGAHFFVVTPDVRFSQILLQQGIGTVKSPE